MIRRDCLGYGGEAGGAARREARRNRFRTSYQEPFLLLGFANPPPKGPFLVERSLTWTEGFGWVFAFFFFTESLLSGMRRDGFATLRVFFRILAHSLSDREICLILPLGERADNSVRRRSHSSRGRAADESQLGLQGVLGSSGSDASFQVTYSQLNAYQARCAIL